MKVGDKLVRFKWYILSGFSLGIIVCLLLGTDFSPADSNKFMNIPASPPTIPQQITFAGENVPVEYFDIRESLEREMTVNVYWHSQTIWLIQKAHRYFPLIESVLKQYNIPDDFKYLAIAESGLSQTVSPAGAVGFWQILEGTAKDYGLEINDEIDERYSIEKATEFACKYFLESYKKYGNWTLAAASYNVGRLGVDRQIDRQKETDYYNLLFNDETARYIFRIIAFKTIFENPEAYGFVLPKDRLYQPIPFKEKEVSGAVPSWADFAKENNTNYKILKMLNPWLRDDKLVNKAGKVYKIKVPDGEIRTDL
jgi:membrane-bound lytic murein transglycosylase D